MDVQRAKELLMVLADGVDPLTGEVLPEDHVCNKGGDRAGAALRRGGTIPQTEKTAARKQWKTLDGGTGR